MLVKNLSKSYRSADGKTTPVFDNFSFDFESGKTTVVMGGSGIGKTTLLNCIAGLTDYDGEISDVGAVAYVFQDDRLLPHKTVYGNVEFILSGYGEAEKSKIVKTALEVTELTGVADKFPDELSGGQKKRVSLAIAFASGRQTLLFDEPLSSLDLGLKYRIYDVLKRVTAGKTTVLVTHDADEALTLANEIAVIGKSGVIYRKKLKFSVVGRDIADDECNAVRKELINVFKNIS